MENCDFCNNKLKIVNFNCDCKGTFCIKCRLPEKHNCNFDYLTSSKLILERNLPKVTTAKIHKI